MTLEEKINFLKDQGYTITRYNKGFSWDHINGDHSGIVYWQTKEMVVDFLMKIIK